MTTPVSTIHIVRVIDVMPSADERTSSWMLNGAERLIDRRKVETSSTSLNIHATFFTTVRHAATRNFISRRAPRCFTGLLGFPSFSSFRPSVPLFLIRPLYISCLLPLYYRHQTREINECSRHCHGY